MLLERLPLPIRTAVEREPDVDSLLEVVLDLGRLPEARFADRAVDLGNAEVSDADLRHITDRIGSFGEDNRAGLERTLHRISALRNRAGHVVGLTCRVGRAIEGTALVIEDIARSGNSILFVGRPGVGKTTMLREVARVLADSAGKRVVIVDTSNEIAGDGDIPHPAIGRARRLQVPTPKQQHAVMIEAVENHMPEVIIIDEMGIAEEALAARTIAERGVQLVATAHGNTLENLLANPTLADLVGGVHTVTLSDEEARRRRTQKTILERRAPPTFDVLVEIQSWERVAVHLDVGGTVDRLLRGQRVTPEERWVGEGGRVESRVPPPQASQRPRTAPSGPAGEFSRTRVPREPEASDTPARTLRIYPFGVSGDRLIRVAAERGLGLLLVDSPAAAEMVLTTKAHYRRRPGVLIAAEASSIPVYVLRRNTEDQMTHFLGQLIPEDDAKDDDTLLGVATIEAEDGVRQVAEGQAAEVRLEPRSAFVRRMQHGIAERAQLGSYSTGRDPRRRVTIHRG